MVANGAINGKILAAISAQMRGPFDADSLSAILGYRENISGCLSKSERVPFRMIVAHENEPDFGYARGQWGGSEMAR